MEFAIGLLLGTAAGIICTALCVSASSADRIFTNADRLALNTERLAEALYNSDDYSDIGCPAHMDEQFEELVGCKYPGENKGCVKCIKEWLSKEVVR